MYLKKQQQHSSKELANILHRSVVVVQSKVPNSVTPCLCPSPLPEFAQVHVYCISDAIQLSHPMLPSSPSAFNLFQHQGLFQ